MSTRTREVQRIVDFLRKNVVYESDEELGDMAVKVWRVMHDYCPHCGADALLKECCKEGKKLDKVRV